MRRPKGSLASPDPQLSQRFAVRPLTSTIVVLRNPAKISSVARGCSAVGSASPCQGEGRGFESRHPLEGASGINPSGGVAEW